jgi:hypothetical protein
MSSAPPSRLHDPYWAEVGDSTKDFDGQRAVDKAVDNSNGISLIRYLAGGPQLSIRRSFEQKGIRQATRGVVTMTKTTRFVAAPEALGATNGDRLTRSFDHLIAETPT